MRWQRTINAALKPVGLTHSQFLVLAALDHVQRAAGDAVNQHMIALDAGLDDATTSAILRALDSRGLIDRGPTDGDARAWRVIVSSTGHSTLRKAVPLVDAAARRFYEPTTVTSTASRATSSFRAE
jgi:DNA-binding MarR family transcriptional regulator